MSYPPGPTGRRARITGHGNVRGTQEHQGAARGGAGSPGGLGMGTRLGGRGLGFVEVFGLDAEELVDGGAEGGVGGELRVGGDQRGGFLPGQADQVLVGEQPEQAQAGVAAGLGGAEYVTLAALLEVEPGQLEAVQGGGHGVQPLP